MAGELEPKKIGNIGVYGLIRPAEVDDSLIPDGAVTEVKNFNFDRKGAASVRLGLTALGSTVLTARPCIGLFNAQQGTALAVFSNGATSAIYSFNGSAWSVSLDGGTASIKARFVDFGSYTIAINFMQNTYSSMRFWNAGSSRHWHYTGNPINPQNMWGINLIDAEVFKNRIYAWQENSSRLHKSSVISIDGNITWSPTADYLDVNPGDGENGTALKRYGTQLLAFKPNNMYRYQVTSVDPDPFVKIGTRSKESIIEGKKGLYFHHDSGFFRYTGGYPIEISRPISDLVSAIPFTQFDDIAAWNDSDHVYWSVGNITVTENGLSQTIKNAVFCFTESSEIWTVYSYPNDIRRGLSYNSGSTLTRIVGTDNGIVATHNSGTTDLGEPIKYSLRTKWIDYGLIAYRKLLSDLTVLCDKAQAQEIKYQVNNEDGKWESLGQAKDLITRFTDKSIRFFRIRFKVTGVSRFESPIFMMIELDTVKNEGLVA